MECLTHSPAFNTVKMQWIAGVGKTQLKLESPPLCVTFSRRVVANTLAKRQRCAIVSPQACSASRRS